MPPFKEPKKRGNTALPSGDPPERTTLQDEIEYVNLMVYGNPGSGKTTDLAHLAKLGPVVFINAEAGLKRTALRQFDLPLENIEIFPAKGQTLTFQALDDLFWEIKGKLDADPGAYVGVNWDSITEIHKILLEQVSHKEYDKAVRKAERAGIEPEIDQFFMDRAYYGVMTEQMRQLIRKYRDLPCHIGLSALPRRDLNEKTGDISYGPALTPALQTDLEGFVDIMCHTELDDDLEAYIGRFRQVGIKKAKDRFKMLPPVLIDPTFDRIISYVNGTLKEEDDPLQKPIIEQRKRRARRASSKTTNDDEGDDES